MPQEMTLYEMLEREFPEELKSMVEGVRQMAAEVFAEDPGLDILNIPVILPFSLDRRLPPVGIFSINRQGEVVH